MATYSWIYIDPTSGQGDGIVQVWADENTGRSAKEGSITFTSDGGSPKVDVTQKGAEAFIAFDNDTVTAAKEGETVYLTGTANTSRITFSLGTGDIDAELPTTYTADTVETENGADIAGDPGNTTAYNFVIAIVIPENKETDEHSLIIKATQNRATASCTIRQAAGDPVLTIDKTAIVIEAAGTPVVDITVTSNTAWTVE